MTDIVHRVGIQAPLEDVFKAVSTVEGVAGWWTEETGGASGVGNTMTFRFRDPAGKVLGDFEAEVVKEVPGEQVQWKVRAGPPEWIGTDITFDLKREGDYTVVIFGHRNWREWVEFTAHCSMKWGVFMLSLKELVETGTGKPSPRDIKIDNWN